MIESLFEELPPPAHDDNGDRVAETTEPPSENLFLGAMRIVRKIVRRRSFPQKDYSSDIEQGILLRLWRWKNTYRERSDRMSGEDWNAFAARTSYNEINRFLAGRKSAEHIPIEAIAEFSQPSVEGHAEVEVSTLVRIVWQEICSLTLRQRRALLLQSQQLVIYILHSGVSDEELARFLGFELDDWYDIRDELPLPDARIAEVIKRLGRNRGSTSSAKSIKKARHEARAKLEKVRGK